MRKLTALFIFATAAAGCGQVDPCSGHAGVCVGLRVEGHVSGLEVLDVAVQNGTLKEDRKTSSAHLTLPVAVALDLPAGSSGDVDITVFGESDDGTLLATGSVSVDLKGSHGKATVTLSAVSGGTPDLSGFSGSSADLSGGNVGSTDMAGCGLVTACMTTGDGCCPSGCTVSTDSDCPAAVCGNGVVESPEICDDNNTVSGDGCDATCSWREKLEVFSGIAGATGHADDPAHYYARLVSPAGVVYDSTGGTMYVVDSGDCTVRTVTGTNINAGAIATLAGSPWNCGEVDGTFTTARFNSPGDTELIGTKLFVVDSPTALRMLDLSAKTVTTIALPSTATLRGIGHYGNKLAFYLMDSAGTSTGLYTYDPTGPTTSKITGALPASACYTQSASVWDTTCDATNCYIACDGNVAKVDMTTLAVGNFAGTYNAASGLFTTGCQTTASTTLAAAKFSGAETLIVDGTGNVIVSDINCDTVVKIAPTAVALMAGVPNSSGYLDNVAPTAAVFNGTEGLANIGSYYYVADRTNGLVRAFGGSGSSIFSIVGAAHDYTESVFSATVQATPNYSTLFEGLTSDGSNVYVIDHTGRILKIALAGGGATLLLAATGQAVQGSYIDIVRIGTTLYAIATSGQIVSVGTDGSNPAIYANTSGIFTPSDGARLAAGMHPMRLATDGTNLFFVDGGKQIREIDAAGMVHTLAGTPSTTDLVDGTGAAAHFDYAGAIAADGKYVYVADTVNGDRGQGLQPPSAIRRLEIATGIVHTIAGKPDTEGHTDGPATAALFAGIYGLATDGTSLFIADAGNDQDSGGPAIRQLVLGTMTVGTSIGEPGQQTFEPGVGTMARVHFPRLIAFDSDTHALIVSDSDEYVFGRIK
jgi:cysteine-rich repeat protein